MTPAGFPDQSLGVQSRIELEHGRYAVYLDVSFWEPTPAGPLQTLARRIGDYPTRRQAEVAARWMLAAADRNLPHPPLGF